MKIFKSVDERLKDLGFKKLDEDNFGVSYVKDVKKYGFRQRLDIIHKESGKHLIHSYQEGMNSDGFNNVVGLSYEETKLAIKKYRQLKRKYEW